MARLGPIYKTWIEELKGVWDSGLAEVTTDVNPKGITGSGEYKTQIEVIPLDTISAAIAEHKKNPTGKICILNFASYKNPGGGFMNGSLAQEEAICYCTNLYPNLAKNWVWYETHKRTLNRGAYSDECLVSHNVSVVAAEPGRLLPVEERFEIDVITCAAPNWNSAIRYSSDDTELLDKLFKAAFDRVKYVMKVLAEYNYDTVILGAFGCGVFKNDPRIIAEAFDYSLRELLPGKFSRVVFAIPDRSSSNYRTFAKQFAAGSASGRTNIFL